MTPKPQSEKLERLLELRAEPMTYIASLPCAEGIVLSADTQETVETRKSHKQYCEKLVTLAGGYPLAFGGAGFGEIIEAFAQELADRVTASAPESEDGLKEIIKASIQYVYDHDIPVSALARQYRTQEFLIAAKPPNGGFCTFRTKGRRVYSVTDCEIIGYETPHNKALLKRMYRKPISMHEAVVLAAFLVSHSKALDGDVGGETRIAVVTDHGAFIDDCEYVSNVEIRAREFLALTDALFLRCADLGAPTVQLAAEIEEFKCRLLELRQRHLITTAKWFFADPQRTIQHNASYRHVPPAFVLQVGTNGDTLVEDRETVDRVQRTIQQINLGAHLEKPPNKS